MRPPTALLPTNGRCAHADGIGSTDGGDAHDRGGPLATSGFEIEAVGTDPHMAVRLGAVAEIEVPHYPGLRIGAPRPAGSGADAHWPGRGPYDAIHVCPPGPVGIAGALLRTRPRRDDAHGAWAACGRFRPCHGGSQVASDPRSDPSAAASQGPPIALAAAPHGHLRRVSTVSRQFPPKSDRMRYHLFRRDRSGR